MELDCIFRRRKNFFTPLCSFTRRVISYVILNRKNKPVMGTARTQMPSNVMRISHMVAAIRYATVAPVFYVHQRSFISWWKKAPFPLIASFTYQLKVYLFFIIKAQRTSYTHFFRHPATVYFIRCDTLRFASFIHFHYVRHFCRSFFVLLSYSLPYIT